MHERRTNPERGQQSTDMLTDNELRERGYKPRFPEATELTELAEPITRPEQKCCFCGRKVESPVSRFERFGINFVDENKVAHEGCARRQFEAVKEVLLKMEN